MLTKFQTIKRYEITARKSGTGTRQKQMPEGTWMQAEDVRKLYDEQPTRRFSRVELNRNWGLADA